VTICLEWLGELGVDLKKLEMLGKDAGVCFVVIVVKLMNRLGVAWNSTDLWR
jgi:hypothetical protein